MNASTIAQLNAQERRQAHEELYRRHQQFVLRQKFRPRKRRIADSWPRMARKEKLHGDAHL